MFFNIAASNNKGAEWLRNRLSKEMTPEQIAEAQRLATGRMAKHQQCVTSIIYKSSINASGLPSGRIFLWLLLFCY